MRAALEIEPFDLVVVGAGIAGASAALAAAAAGLNVAVLTKVALGTGGATPLAQGGIAAALAADDTAADHATDTTAAAAGLADAEMVSILTREGPERVLALIESGARFDSDSTGELLFGREAAHGRARILHARGDATGAEVSRVMTSALRAAPSVQIFEHTQVLDLCLEQGSERRVVGLQALAPAGERLLLAPAVVLATGGLGRLYSCTTNPQEATGDGVAIAARAGATLVDLEFVQFHPTVLAGGADPQPLLTEALRGAGAILIDGNGERFMTGIHPLAELAPRDVVARAIWERHSRWQPVFLDARETLGSEFPRRFPTAFEACQRQGLDPRVEPMPVSPAAHYSMGGIAVDREGRSSLPGLWAAGEVACTGVHGGNRLASNSLLEGLVFGHRIANSVTRAFRPIGSRRNLLPYVRIADVATSKRAELGEDLRSVMWRDVGLVRTREGLERAAGRLTDVARELGTGRSETHNMLDVAKLVVQAAYTRRESRGAHYRTDYPQTEPAWRRRIELRVDSLGTIEVTRGPLIAGDQSLGERHGKTVSA